MRMLLPFLACLYVMILTVSDSFARDAASTTATSPATAPTSKKSGPSFTITADHDDCLYMIGQTAAFVVKGTNPDGSPYLGQCNYRVMREDGRAQIEAGTLDLAGGSAGIKGTLDHPGFIRAQAWIGGREKGIATTTVGFEPEKITATQKLPADFMDYWKGEKAKLDAIPMDLHRHETTGKDPNKFLYEYVDFQNVDGKRFYIGLSQPRKPGKYAVRMFIPGAGVGRGPVGVESSKNTITVTTSIHDYPIDKPAEYYDDVIPRYTRTVNGKSLGYYYWDVGDRNTYYYHSVVLGLLRAMDIALAEPNVGLSSVTVWGGSQGGGLSLAVGALDSRVTYIHAFFPVWCDHTAGMVTKGRQPGWPGVLQTVEKTASMDDAVKTTQYYDTCNFVRFIKAPVFIFQGFNDGVTPPSGCYAAYALITSPKQLVVHPASGHGATKDVEKDVELKEDAFRRQYLGDK